MKKIIMATLLCSCICIGLTLRAKKNGNKTIVAIINNANKPAIISAIYTENSQPVTNNLCAGCDIFLAPENPKLGTIKEVQIASNPDKSSPVTISNPEAGRTYKASYENNQWSYK